MRAAACEGGGGASAASRVAEDWFAEGWAGLAPGLAGAEAGGGNGSCAFNRADRLRCSINCSVTEWRSSADATTGAAAGVVPMAG